MNAMTWAGLAVVLLAVIIWRLWAVPLYRKQQDFAAKYGRRDVSPTNSNGRRRSAARHPSLSRSGAAGSCQQANRPITLASDQTHAQ